MKRIFLKFAAQLFKIPPIKNILLRCYVAGGNEEEALEMTTVLHNLGLGIISNFLGEEVTDRKTAIRIAKIYIRHIRRLGYLRAVKPQLAVSIKLSQLGLKIDRKLTERLARWILKEARTKQIGLEIDIEGPDTFEDALEVIKTLACEGRPFRVALAANQTFSDKLLEVCLSCRLPMRIVKGACLGDIKRGRDIDENFIALFSRARSRNLDVAAATHNIKLLKRIAESYGGWFTLNIQMLFGVRMFWQEKQKVWTYMPWGWEAERFLLRRLEEGIRFKVLLLFIINIFEMLIWRAGRASPR